MSTLWRLRSPTCLPSRPVRQAVSRGRRNSSSPSAKTSDPLRILFCGSDPFSIASLHALHAEHARDPSFIQTIDVLCRPSKRTGRGLKTLTSAPINSAASTLGLRVHEIDTFTGWTPPFPFNLVVAVSFGLLVPPRVLGLAKYGGVNVHPSLLPDLRGPAPVHRALLKRRRWTGVSLQTLHPREFDRGAVLAQTEWPGVEIPGGESCTPGRLLEVLTPMAAGMLVEGLRERVFVEPVVDVGWYGMRKGGEEVDVAHAPKIGKEDMRVEWSAWDVDEILLRVRVLGQVWDEVQFGEEKKRVVYHGFSPFQATSESEGVGPGTLFLANDGAQQRLLVRICGEMAHVLEVDACTVSGRPKGEGKQELIAMIKKRDGIP